MSLNISNEKLLESLNSLLKPEEFQDAAYNGLQIEGKTEIKKIICGVSCNLDLIEKAVELKADAVFVHHGLFWKPGLMNLSGFNQARIKKLLENNINLYAYHLPLDAHEKYGNNIRLCEALSLKNIRAFGKYKSNSIGFAGDFEKSLNFEKILDLITQKIGKPNFEFNNKKLVKNMAICSGGAPDLIHEAIDSNYDLYLTGEATEWVTSISKESGCDFVAAGHHATERFGPKAIADYFRKDLGLDAEFVDIPNPV